MQLTKKQRISSWLFDEITHDKNQKNNSICYIPIHAITPNPYQPRREFNQDSLEELAQSIRRYGVLQPITVRRLFSGDYELIAGERRLRAASLAGMLKIPAMIVSLNDNDSAIVALVENIQRENLNFMEEAEAYRSLLFHHGLTQEELASSLGKTQSSVANKVRLLKLSKVVREIIKENSLSERHARALLRLENEEDQIYALEKITDGNLNVRQSEDVIDEIIEAKKSKIKPVSVRSIINRDSLKDMRLFTNTLRHAVDLMHRHGIEAVSVETEYEDYIEYTITIPKELGAEKIS